MQNADRERDDDDSDDAKAPNLERRDTPADAPADASERRRMMRTASGGQLGVCGVTVMLVSA